VELRDDRSLSGLIKSEDAGDLLMVFGGGTLETVPRAQIREIRALTLSLMPEALEQVIGLQPMADLISFLSSGAAAKRIEGNDPKLVAISSDGVLLLAASNAELYGGEITFEAPFKNIGMWQGQNDYAAWTTEITAAVEYDVYFDFACAESAAGNRFNLATSSHQLLGTITATGSDWSQYQQLKMGRLHLDSGRQRISFRPEGPLKGALIDLRTIALVLPGKKPNWPALPAVALDSVLRDANSVARYILDESAPAEARQAAVHANPQFAADLIREMTRDLVPATPEEYKRIPWIWRVAVACGKRSEPGQIKRMLQTALPTADEPLRDWQAVVIGGGIINGLSQRGASPVSFLEPLVRNDGDLFPRWERALHLASEMADNQQVPTGTRYDAVRMLGVEDWQKRGGQLSRYLAKDAHSEVQMGAVSALLDLDSQPATRALLSALPSLAKENATLAVSGFLREDRWLNLLLDDCLEGKISPTVLSAAQRQALLSNPNPALHAKAARALEAQR
jgi:hypothetical protein